LANDTGIAVNTAKAWLSLLEASYIVYLIQPYYKNFRKRLIKSPKLYFYDTGVACSLLKLSNPEMINTHYLYGSLFENLVITEVLKNQCHWGKRPSVYYWHESNGTEIDCIIEQGNNQIVAIEIKGGQTFTKDYMKNLRNFAKDENGVRINKVIVYAGDQSTNIKDIELIPWNMLSTKINTLI
jgi:predicted AAA+ superfamily ATPase